MSVPVIIVGHPGRTHWIVEQMRHLDVVGVVMDNKNQGARWNHWQALELAYRMPERVVIMEDDAIPVQGFNGLARRWLDFYPQDLISFYLGTSRPVEWQPIVDHALIQAHRSGEVAISVDRLLHGVCYSLPRDGIPGVLERMTHPEADRAIGLAWGKSVIYPVESLVQHRDGTPVEKHPDRKPRDKPRIARALAAPLAYEA